MTDEQFAAAQAAAIRQIPIAIGGCRDCGGDTRHPASVDSGRCARCRIRLTAAAAGVAEIPAGRCPGCPTVHAVSPCFPGCGKRPTELPIPAPAEDGQRRKSGTITESE